MEHRQNRREQQRKKLIRIAIAVAVLLAAAVMALTTGLFSDAGGFPSGRNTESADAGTAGWTASVSVPETIVYDGKKYAYNDHLSNYLLMGIDTRGSIKEEKPHGSAGQSDSIFILSYDRAEETLVGLAVPRDTITQIELFSPAGDSNGFAMDHLCLQYAYGDGRHESCKLTSTAVSKLLNGIPFSGYTAINMTSIPQLTELLGGVEVTVPDDSLEKKDPTFKKGSKVVLDATNTETFVRTRDIGIEQSAIIRMNRQKVFLEAFGDKLAQEQKKDASTVTRLFETMKPEMISTMSNDIFVDLALAARVGGVQTIPGETGHEEGYDVYRVDEAELYKMVITLFYREVE